MRIDKFATGALVSLTVPAPSSRSASPANQGQESLLAATSARATTPDGSGTSRFPCPSPRADSGDSDFPPSYGAPSIFVLESTTPYVATAHDEIKGVLGVTLDADVGVETICAIVKSTAMPELGDFRDICEELSIGGLANPEEFMNRIEASILSRIGTSSRQTDAKEHTYRTQVMERIHKLKTQLKQWFDRVMMLRLFLACIYLDYLKGQRIKLHEQYIRDGAEVRERGEEGALPGLERAYEREKDRLQREILGSYYTIANEFLTRTRDIVGV